MIRTPNHQVISLGAEASVSGVIHDLNWLLDHSSIFAARSCSDIPPVWSGASRVLTWDYDLARHGEDLTDRFSDVEAAAVAQFPDGVVDGEQVISHRRKPAWCH